VTNVGPSQLFAVIWIGWLASWIAAAFWSARTKKRAVTPGVAVYRAAILAGAILLTPIAARIAAKRPIWDVGEAGAYALAGLTLVGILFAWWARIHLGPLWSSAVTRKEGHRVIDTGPYALVRHPIYTGLIGAIWATAVAEGTAIALIGATFLSFGLWLKARTEERFLVVELGTDAYGAYYRRVPMLVPFLPRGSGIRDQASEISKQKDSDD
jgi:protein-S-isoprenylcysteine O-methyltransferase Ste14